VRPASRTITMDPEVIASNLVRVGVLAISDRDDILEEVGHAAWKRSGGEEIELALPPTQFALLRLLTLARGKCDEVSSVLRDWCDAPNPAFRCHLILTVGGDTFAEGDVVPEATRAVIEREAPGLAELLRQSAMERADNRHSVRPLVAMSRSIAGLRKSTLIVNLPSCFERPAEALDALLPLLPVLLDALHLDDD